MQAEQSETEMGQASLQPVGYNPPYRRVHRRRALPNWEYQWQVKKEICINQTMVHAPNSTKAVTQEVTRAAAAAEEESLGQGMEMLEWELAATEDEV